MDLERSRSGPGRGERGSATVEQAGLLLLVAAVAVAMVAGARMLDREGTPPLASELMRKQRCAVRHPRPCWQDPLTEAYGRAIAGAVRALAPPPRAVIGPSGIGLVGVDYRRCRGVRCATPLPGSGGARLTLSNRRTAAFTAVREMDGEVAIDYWIYRPTIGWELVTARPSREQIAALARTRLTDDTDPKLVPLELTLGRDAARFPIGEEPPWRGHVDSRWGGR